jgi:tetratricopeptide (TPR) repeat protein
VLGLPMREPARKDISSAQGKGPDGRPSAEPCSSCVPATPPVRSPRLVGWRKWLLRVGLVLLSPAVALALLEAGLRLAGYGSPSEFLVSPDGGQTFTANEHFTCRFMPQRVATRGDVVALPARKAPGTVRIFVLGESAAMGVPNPAFSFGRVLERMLQQRWPGTHFEVVNAAVMGIDSHAMTRIARDCAAHEPDLLLIYAGNNEMVGPCSPLMRMGRLAASGRILDAWLWLRGTRVAQLASACAERLGAGADDAKPQTMEFFLAHATAPEDTRRHAVREHFAQNLADCCRSARAAGAGVVLCTVAANLSANPPFASLHRNGLGPADLAKWQRLVDCAAGDERNGLPGLAAGSYREALELDDHYAELHFRLARCLSAAGDRPAARTHYAHARDLDALPFRATGPLNDVVRATARQFQGAGVAFVDADQAFRAAVAEPGGPGDQRLFSDHCHPTFAGNWLLASTVLSAVEELLAGKLTGRPAGPAASQEQCAQGLGLTGWDQLQWARIVAAAKARPPFTNQLDYAQSQAAAAEELNRMARWDSPAARRQAAQQVRLALEQSPDDWRLHESLANLFGGLGDWTGAAEHRRAVARQFPWNAAKRAMLADALAAQGNFGEAADTYAGAIRMDGQFAPAHRGLGLAKLRLGGIDAALPHLEQALRLEPDPAGYCLVGNALAAGGRLGQAEAWFRKGLALAPSDAALRRGLVAAMESQGRASQAKALPTPPANARAAPTAPVGGVPSNRG